MIGPENLWNFAVSMLYHEGENETSLRRAVSACYYAVFHAIAASGAATFSGPLSLQNRIARSHNHAAISTAAKDVERQFRSSMTPSAEADLLRVAQSFVRLQEQRNRADYDLQTTITWEETDELLDEARRALNALAKLQGQAILAEFLLSPLLQRRRGNG